MQQYPPWLAKANGNGETHPVAWRDLVASAREKPTTDSSPSCVPLSLHRPRPVYRPTVPRNLAEVPPAIATAMQDCVEGMSPWPLVLLGGVGVGKTCAALALCDCVPRSLYHTFRGLCETYRQAAAGTLTWYSQGNGGLITPDMLASRLTQADLVALDEIGTREATDFQYELLHDLLELRLGRPLVVISNMGLDGLAQAFDERIVSRLLPGTLVRVEGPDRRDPRQRRSEEGDCR